MPEKLTKQVTVNTDGVALGGMDPVSYFGPAGPTPGSPSITESHGGAVWQFVNDANRAAFVTDPGKYMPKFGGHCAFGAAKGQAFPGSPKAWKVVDGHLYLSINRFVGTVLGPTPARIAKAEAAWRNAA